MSGGGGDGLGCPLWIISFADMIANLLIFFILLATFASRNTDGNAMPKKVLDKQVGVFGSTKDRQHAAMTQRPGTVANHGDVAPERGSKRRGADGEALRELLQDSRYRVRARVNDLEDGVRISLDESGVFVAGSDQLSAEGRELVGEVGRFYRHEPVLFVVEAHTDDRSFRFSSHDSDVALTSAMGISVAGAIHDLAGVEPERVGVSPRGASQPLAPNTTAGGRAQNRRVEIVVRERP